MQRGRALRQVVHEMDQPQLVLSEGITGAGVAFFRKACQLGLEGVVAKCLTSRYRPGRRAWIKIKATQVLGRGSALFS